MAWKGRYVAGSAVSNRFVLSFNLGGSGSGPGNGGGVTGKRAPKTPENGTQTPPHLPAKPGLVAGGGVYAAFSDVFRGI